MKCVHLFVKCVHLFVKCVHLFMKCVHLFVKCVHFLMKYPVINAKIHTDLVAITVTRIKNKTLINIDIDALPFIYMCHCFLGSHSDSKT